MIQFADANGKKWSFRGVASRVERLRDVTGIDLGMCHEQEGIVAFQQVIEDRPAALKLVRAAVEEQDAVQPLSDEDWEELWPGDELTTALFAIGREAARFFTPLRSKAAISSLDRLKRAYLEVIAEMEQTISNVVLPQIDAATLAESSGSTPAN